LREYPGLVSRDAYGDVVSTIVRESPEVLVCYDDTTALNLIALLRQRGILVPDDIAVTGFDDIPYAQLSNPSLTTVTQPAEYLGRQAASILLDMLDSGRPGASEDVPLSLVVRESTGPLVG
jgi:DNA-binding LacI/PurR family transcriptional regulator